MWLPVFPALGDPCVSSRASVSHPPSPGAGERDGDWSNPRPHTHTPRLCAAPWGLPTLSRLPTWASWVGKLRQGPSAGSPRPPAGQGPGLQDLVPAPPQPSSCSGCSQERVR